MNPNHRTKWIGVAGATLNALTFSAFFQVIRLFGGELGAAIMQRLIAVREQFHSNMLGLEVKTGDWLTEERLRLLTGALVSGSSGVEEALGRALVLLGGQVRQQAYTLAFIDGFLTIASVCAGAIVLIAFMKPMKIFFDVLGKQPK